MEALKNGVFAIDAYTPPRNMSIVKLRTFNIYQPQDRQRELRVAVVRHLPRGQRKEDRNFDVWLPLLAPSADLLKTILKTKILTPAFIRRYHAEMKRPDPRHVIELLAALATRQPLAVGCHCEDESNCHRTLLADLIRAAAADTSTT